ncbi:MAG: type II toxin-antitoxin system HicA family toxin [Defluviitaleaceae bacterium]|nr:type II toxin-antitoxin system HicA family toxin [Defluviitaleaceae bacterium]
MNKKKLLARLQSNRKNVRYNDFILLVKSFGFKYRRTEGSHNIYKNPIINEALNLQEEKGEAKPYQVKQFLAIIEKYNLKMECEQ